VTATPIFLEPDPEELPSDWRILNELNGIEVRQISLDTYQMRNKYDVVTVNREGFNLYREHNYASFAEWMRVNNVESVARDDKPQS
jgi:hypothetical protein